MGDEEGKGWREKPRAESIKLEITPKKKKGENLVFGIPAIFYRLLIYRTILINIF